MRSRALNKDKLSKERRSWNMSRIRGKDTGPEKVVRSLLHRMGFRFRLHGKKLPGRPDIVLPKYKTVVFVHGCFWHRHRGCVNCTTPTNDAPRDSKATNRSYALKITNPVAVFIQDSAIRYHLHRLDVFLNCYRIVEIAFPIQELLQSDHGMIDNLALGFNSRPENNGAVLAIENGRHLSFTEGVDENAKAICIHSLKAEVALIGQSRKSFVLY